MTFRCPSCVQTNSRPSVANSDRPRGKMPGVKRRIFNLLAVVSLVLCAATVVFWVRSYYRWDGVDWSRGWTAWELRSAGGTFAIQFDRHSPDDFKPYYYF